MVKYERMKWKKALKVLRNIKGSQLGRKDQILYTTLYTTMEFLNRREEKYGINNVGVYKVKMKKLFRYRWCIPSWPVVLFGLRKIYNIIIIILKCESELKPLDSVNGFKPCLL